MGEVEVHESESSRRGSEWKGKELFLDTKGACFLCLEEAPNSVDGGGDNDCKGEDGASMTEACLRNICRYLRINPCAILLRSLKGSLLDEEDQENDKPLVQRDKCDFSVMLCVTCSRVTRRLSELIREEEMIKMLMKDKLQQFNRVLLESEKELESHDRWKKLEEKMLSPVEVGVVKHLRQETQKKSTARLHQLTAASQPKIWLYRSNDALVEPKPTAHEVTTYCEKSEDVKIYNVTNIEGITTTVQVAGHLVRNKLPLESEWDSPNEWISEMLSHQCKKLSRNQYRCPFCQTTRSDPNMRMHLLLVHTDKCFAHVKIPELLESKFRTYCRIVLRLETRKAVSKKKLQQPTANGDYSCSSCKRSFSAPQGFKYHFILTHFKIFEQKLLRLQKVAVKADITPQQQPSQTDEILKVASTTPKPFSEIFIKHTKNVTKPGKGSRFSRRYQCNVCPETSTSTTHPEIVMKKHLVNMHPELFFEQKRLPELSVKGFHTCSKQVLKLCSNDNNTPSEQGQCTCPSCGAMYTTTFDLRYHLMLKHYETLEDRLLGVQTEFLTESKQEMPVLPEMGTFAENFRSEDDQTLYSELCKLQNKSCTCSLAAGGCGRKFSSIYILRRHKIKGCFSPRSVNRKRELKETGHDDELPLRSSSRRSTKVMAVREKQNLTSTDQSDPLQSSAKKTQKVNSTKTPSSSFYS